MRVRVRDLSWKVIVTDNAKREKPVPVSAVLLRKVVPVKLSIALARVIAKDPQVLPAQSSHLSLLLGYAVSTNLVTGKHVPRRIFNGFPVLQQDAGIKKRHR